MKKIESILRSGLNLPHPFVMATIIDTGGSSPRDIGTKMIITGRHDFLGTIGGGVLEEMVILDAMESLQEKKPRKKSYSLGTKTGQCCGGVVEVFFEVFGISPRLFVFGAGHISQALMRTMEDTIFDLYIIDQREQWCHKSQAFSVSCEEPSQYIEKNIFSNKDYAIILTHSHDLDFKLLDQLINKNLNYIGLIGSQTKKIKFLHRFIKLYGDKIAKEKEGRYECPMGFEIGGKSPSEVSISISAKLLSLYYK